MTALPAGLTRATSWLRRDPRHYQIASLASLLAYGLLRLDFDISLVSVLVTIGTALATQWLCSKSTPGVDFRSKWPEIARRDGKSTPGVDFDPRSALISGLSLCLLLRTNVLWLSTAAAVVAIGSKFAFRIRGKHIFNPTNIGLVLMMLATGRVWVSPGQWGNVAFFAFLMTCVGGLVVNRAARSDVTYAFIVSYVALVAGRSLWLGEPLTIPLHRLENGALLLFTFFMISDPKTTPNSRVGRILFAVVVAIAAWYIQFRLFRTNGLLWSLAGAAMLVPAIDWLLPARRYEWSGDGSRLRKQEDPRGMGPPFAPSRLREQVRERSLL